VTRVARLRHHAAERAAPTVFQSLPPCEALRLTPLEGRLYETLAHRPGQLVSRPFILSRVWGRTTNDRSGSNILEVYLRYLRRKLAVYSPNLMIQTVRGRGYVLHVESTDPGHSLALLGRSDFQDQVETT
jgi:DNA-binding response OmpR family regulator